MNEEETMRENIAQLLATRGDKYSEPGLFKVGGTRYLYEARWGPNRDREVVVKVDKEPKNLRAARHIARGCDTHNELAHVASIDHPGVAKIIDYFSPAEASKYGINGWVTVEEKVPDSESLEEKVSEEGVLSRGDALSIAMQLTRTMKDVVSEYGLYHRDLKPSNVVINKKGRVKIVDWANACKTGEAKRKYEPTAGGHESTHPRLMSSFTGQEAEYSEKDEVYAVCSNLARAIRGRPIFNYDDLSGKAIAWDSGESLLTDGKLDADKHEIVLERAIKNLPRKYRIFRDVLKRGLTLYEGQRIQTLKELETLLNYTRKKTDLLGRAKRWGVAAGLTVAIGAAIAGYGAVKWNEVKFNKERSKYQTATEMERRAEAIRRYIRSNRQYEDFGVQNFGTDDSLSVIAERNVGAWLDMFKDKRVGMAADMDPNCVYECMMQAGIDANDTSFSYEQIQPFIQMKNPNLYWKMYGFEHSYVDGWVWADSPRERIKGQWEATKRDYKAKQEAEKKRLEEERRMDRALPRQIGK